MGKESEKEWIYVYVYLNHFAVQLKLTQHCKSTILQHEIKILKKASETLCSWSGLLRNLSKSHNSSVFLHTKIRDHIYPDYPTEGNKIICGKLLWNVKYHIR